MELIDQVVRNGVYSDEKHLHDIQEHARSTLKSIGEMRDDLKVLEEEKRKEMAAKAADGSGGRQQEPTGKEDDLDDPDDDWEEMNITEEEKNSGQVKQPLDDEGHPEDGPWTIEGVYTDPGYGHKWTAGMNAEGYAGDGMKGEAEDVQTIKEEVVRPSAEGDAKAAVPAKSSDLTEE